MRTLTLRFENKEFNKILKAKRDFPNWESYILWLVELEKMTNDYFNKQIKGGESNGGI